MVVYRLNVRYKVPLTQALITHFTGGAYLSLEGDLSRCNEDIQCILGAEQEPRPPLTRHTLSPTLRFVILPLEASTTDAIITRILPRIGMAHNIVHTQIAREGLLVFGAYDNFHPKSTWVSAQIPRSMLEELQDRGVLKGFSLAGID